MTHDLPVCYIKGPGRDSELRYSLRSLVNLPHSHVVISGHVPEWVTRVERIHVPQDGVKQRNVRANIKAMCLRYDKWILFWDDVFVTRPTELHPMNRGPVRKLVATHYARGEKTPYMRDIEDTGLLLERLGYEEPLAYDCIHVPQVIHSEYMLEAIDIAEANGVNAVLTIHGNLAGLGGEQVINAKRPTGWSRRAFVSTSEKRWREGVGEYIRDLFPEPSVHELPEQGERMSYPDYMTSLTPLPVVQYLHDMAARVPATQCIVEIGVYRGRTTCWLAHGAQSGRGAHVYGIDPWDLPDHQPAKPKFSRSEQREIAQDYVRKTGHADHATLIQGYSQAVGASWEGPKVGLLYVDGDHTTDGVLRDWEAWRPHLAGTATIVFDDYDDDSFGVRKAVDHLHAEGHITRPTVVAGRVAVARLPRARHAKS